MSAIVVLALTAAAFAADETGSPANPPTGDPKEVQDLKRQMADQQKQIEDLRLIVLGQKKEIDSVAATAAAAPASPAEPAPAPKSVSGGVASLAPIVPPLPAAPAPKPAVPPAPTPAPQAPAAAAASDAPLQLKIGGTTIVPIGFMDFTNTWRSTADGDSLKTNFGKFPYNNSLPLARDTENKMSLQNSRIGARLDGTYKDWHYLGYWESDFVGDFAGNNTQVTSNSVLFRLRLYWINLRNKHFEVQAGQSWSLLTPNRNGLSALPGDLFYGQEFDVNYLNGLTWGRIPGIRFIYHSGGDKINFGVSLENADQYFGGYGGATTPTLPAAFAASFYGNQIDGGQTNDVSIPQLKPDVIAKLAIQPNSKVHVEVAGVESETKVYNSTTNTFFTKVGAGGSINANFAILPKLRLITNNFWSDGEGRYLFGEVPNFIIRADGSPSPIHAGSTVDGLEASVGKFQFYLYYGGIASGKNIALDANGKTPIGWGYTGSPNAENKAIQEVTFGWTHTLWRDAKYGGMQWMAQYAYFTRSPFYDAANSPKNAHQDAIWFNLRYVLPGSAPAIKY
jgi:hypothetical protein